MGDDTPRENVPQAIFAKGTFSAGAFTQGMANVAQGDEQPSQRHIVLDERHATADDKRLCKLTLVAGPRDVQ